MNSIQEILNILNIFLPYEICLQIIYKYNGFISPTCLLMKPFIINCNNFVLSKCIKRIEIYNISPRLSKIYKVKKQKWIIYNYRKRYPIIITCHIVVCNSKKIISYNHYF